MGIQDTSRRELTFPQSNKKIAPSSSKLEHADKENHLSADMVSALPKLALSPHPLKLSLSPHPLCSLGSLTPSAARNTSQKRPSPPFPCSPQELLSPHSQGGGLKRQRCISPITKSYGAEKDGVSLMSSAVHQFGLIGNGKDYDSKEVRLKQLLERIDGPAIVFASTTQICHSIEEIVESCRRAHARTSPNVPLANSSDLSNWPQHKARSNSNDSCNPDCSETTAAIPRVTVVAKCCKPHRGSYRYVINWDLPPTGKKYLEHLEALGDGPVCEPLGYVYTFVQEKDLNSRRLSPIIGLLQRVRKAAEKRGDRGMVAEALGALQQLGAVVDEDDEEEEEGDGEAEEGEEEVSEEEQRAGKCAVSFHCSDKLCPADAKPTVEIVRIPMRGLENLDGIKSIIAPRLEHSSTIICLHCLNIHGPWDGFEHCFALPESLGAVRVILVLAKNCSFHDYPDHGSLMGGVSWVDILDWDSMNKSDHLLEGLVDYEISLLGGRSDRVFLSGISQGGGQSLLRFIRSEKQLGGWIGAVCHVPTVPHLPRQHDIVNKGQPLANAGRPVRLLCGECDSVFPPALVLRDIERLRTVGGFSDVRVEVMAGLTHEDMEGRKDQDPPAELVYLSEHLSEILIAANTKP